MSFCCLFILKRMKVNLHPILTPRSHTVLRHIVVILNAETLISLRMDRTTTNMGGKLIYFFRSASYFTHSYTPATEYTRFSFHQYPFIIPWEINKSVYFTLLKKVKTNSWIRPFIQISTKSLKGLFWTQSLMEICSFCVISWQTNQRTDKLSCRPEI